MARRADSAEIGTQHIRVTCGRIVFVSKRGRAEKREQGGEDEEIPGDEPDPAGSPAPGRAPASRGLAPWDLVLPQRGLGPGFAHLRKAAQDRVGVLDRRRHQHRGLVGRVAEHQALVTGALFFAVAAIHSLVDIG